MSGQTTKDYLPSKELLLNERQKRGNLDETDSAGKTHLSLTFILKNVKPTEKLNE